MMSKDNIISIRIGEDVQKKLDTIINLLNEKSINKAGEYEVSKSEAIISAIDLYYFSLVNENSAGIVYETIVNAINTYLRSQVKVDNYFKNNLLTEVIINQELIKEMLLKNQIDYEDITEIIQDRINDRIMTGTQDG